MAPAVWPRPVSERKASSRRGAAISRSEKIRVARQQGARGLLGLRRHHHHGVTIGVDRDHAGQCCEHVAGDARAAAQPPRHRLALDLRGRAVGDEPAVIQDEHAIRQRIGLLEVVGRQQNRAPFIDEAPDLGPEAAPGIDVEADRGLV